MTSTLLYVDDDETNRAIFDAVFGPRFDLRIVSSGPEALDVLDEVPVAVLVTDQRMPEMTGNELLEIVKTRFPTMIRIIITAYSDLDSILSAVNSGLVHRYVVKPWDNAELTATLNWALDAYRVGLESGALQLRLIETERLATVGTVAAGIVHDLSQPLTYLSGGVSRLADFRPLVAELAKLDRNSLSKTASLLLNELAEEFDVIVDDMKVGCDLMSDTIKEQRRLLRPAPVDASPCADPSREIDFVLNVTRAEATRVDARCQYQGPSPLPGLKISATSFTRALLNLVSNALHATERSERRGEVTIEAEVIDGNLAVTVRDNGPGFDNDTGDQLGTLLFSTRVDGTGLGLAETRRLVSSEGGRLEIEGKLGVGAVFRIVLPLET